MSRIIFILLLLSTSLIYAEDEFTPEPYEYEEFSPVLHDIRRASIIFCGAFPLGYMYSSIIGDPILSSSGIYDDLDSSEQSNKEIEVKLISSLIFAGSVTIIDFIIEKFFRGS